MMKIFVPVASFVLLVFGLALTQVSSPDYRWTMSASLLCALGALTGFLLSAHGRTRRVAAGYRAIAVLGGVLAIYSIAAVVSISLKR